MASHLPACTLPVDGRSGMQQKGMEVTGVQGWGAGRGGWAGTVEHWRQRRGHLGSVLSPPRSARSAGGRWGRRACRQPLGWRMGAVGGGRTGGVGVPVGNSGLTHSDLFVRGDVPPALGRRMLRGAMAMFPLLAVCVGGGMSCSSVGDDGMLVPLLTMSTFCPGCPCCRERGQASHW